MAIIQLFLGFRNFGVFQICSSGHVVPLDLWDLSESVEILYLVDLNSLNNHETWDIRSTAIIYNLESWKRLGTLKLGIFKSLEPRNLEALDPRPLKVPSGTSKFLAFGVLR